LPAFQAAFLSSPSSLQSPNIATQSSLNSFQAAFCPVLRFRFSGCFLPCRFGQAGQAKGRKQPENCRCRRFRQDAEADESFRLPTLSLLCPSAKAA